MSGYDAGRYAVHDLAVVELAGAHAPVAFFLPGLPTASARPDLVWDDDPAGLRPVVDDPRDPGHPRCHAGITEDGWRLAGAGHDGRLPLQDVLLRKRASLVHGTALAIDGRGVLLLGPPGSGKTVLALAALTEPGWQLVADDVVVTTASGQLLSTEAPLAIYPEHAAVLPSDAPVRTSSKRAWRAVRDTPVIGRAAQAAKRWATRRRGAVGGWAGSFEARYRSVAPAGLFPPERRVEAARLDGVLTLDPSADPWRVAGASAGQSAAVAVAEVYADGDVHAQLARYGRAGVVDVAAHWRAAAEVLGEMAASSARHATLGVPRRAAPVELLGRAHAAITDLLG